jgi:hypothetical protein
METNLNERVEIDEPEVESEEKRIDSIENESTHETLRAIDRANAAAERLELANKKREELLNRQEEMLVKATFGGKAEGGLKARERTEEEFAKDFLDGKEDVFLTSSI